MYGNPPENAFLRVSQAATHRSAAGVYGTVRLGTPLFRAVHGEENKFPFDHRTQPTVAVFFCATPGIFMP
jgi:hypothetical protein